MSRSYGRPGRIYLPSTPVENGYDRSPQKNVLGATRTGDIFTTQGIRLAQGTLVVLQEK